jgi:hypothetical protein
MSARISVWLAACGVTVALTAAPVAAQPAKSDQPPAKPEWVAAHDLKVRKGKDTDWDKSQKVGVEVFRDTAGKAVVAITAAGTIAVAPDDTPGKKAEWVSALSFSVRGANDDKFTAASALFGVETFKGVLPGQIAHVSERGGLALYKADAATGPGKDPQFQYGLALKVRKPGQAAFATDSKAYGLEAYKDNNTGGLVYVTEGGQLAAAGAVPDKAPDTKDVRKPKPLYGLEASARKADEANFTDKTQKIGIEVFQDQNTGTLLYISEAGSIAAVPPPGEVKKEQKLSWMHAMSLKARPGGEQDFAKARKYGVEVFKDNHTGYLVYVCETGAIAVLPRK